MPNFGAPELLIILVIVLLIFGVGRLSRVGGELGRGIREFRKGLRGDDDPTPPKPAESEDRDQGGSPK